MSAVCAPSATRAGLALAVYVAAPFALAPFVAYLLYAAIGLAGLDAPFHKVVMRTLQLLALLGLWPLLVVLGRNDRRAWGYGQTRREFLRQLALGLAAGVAMLAVLVGTLLVLGVRVPEPDLEWSKVHVPGLVAGAVLAALVIGFIEETWFRGALFGALASGAGVLAATAVTAVLYSAVHFVKSSVVIEQAAVGWLSGFSVIAGAFHRFGSTAIVDSALALAAAGVLLALVRARTGGIAACIGLHAGWVIVIKVTREVTDFEVGSPWAFLAGRYDGVTGYLALGWLAVLALLYGWRCPAPGGASGRP